MKAHFDDAEGMAAMPDYRALRIALAARAVPAAAPAHAAPADAHEQAACSFSRAGLARLLGFDPRDDDRQGKECLNPGGSSFGESGGVGRMGHAGAGAGGRDKIVQGSHA